MQYVVYLLRCADNTFYTGVTTDVARRLREHNHGARGARYTKARRPVALVYQELAEDRANAQRREYALRSLSHTQKQQLTEPCTPLRSTGRPTKSGV